MNRARVDLTSLIRRHPLAAFFLWFFTVGQLLAFLPRMIDVPVPDQWFINAATVVGLLLPAVVISRVVDGEAGLRRLRGAVTRVRAPLRLYVVGLVAVPVVSAAIALALLGPPEVPVSVMVEALGDGLVLNAVLGLVLNNLWEEVAWMGFVQARLQARHGALRGAALTAPLFALQHISLYLGGGAATAALILVLATLVMFFFRAFNAWLYNSSGSLFLVGLVHATGNAVAPGNGFAAGYLRQLYTTDTELAGVLHTLAFALLAILLIVATRGRLGLAGQGSPGLEPDEAPPVQ